MRAQTGSFESMLTASAWIASARFASDGTLVWANPRFVAICGGCARGARLTDLVAEGQVDEIARMLESRELPVEARNVHFAAGDGAPATLVVTWAWDGDELVLLGEPPFADIETTQTALVKLNGRVSDLARENAKKSAQLEKALDELRHAQAMLVHREKMAALGQMTAGVAHELNNPLAYVKNNLYMVRRGVEDLLSLIDLFGGDLDAMEQSRPDLFETVMDKIEAIDLPRLGERLPELLTSVDEGVERAAGLVRGLRTFSRLDEAEVKSVDVNESLRSVAEFAGFLLKDREVGLTLDLAELPMLTCAPGQLNQAFLNILTNAAQASPKGGTVQVSTRLGDGEVVIAISDEGPGVPADIAGRVFEPFFTTRPVGEGTGLGLSIAHTVVTSHGGSISIGDAEGGGAVFTIHLPLVSGGES